MSYSRTRPLAVPTSRELWSLLKANADTAFSHSDDDSLHLNNQIIKWDLLLVITGFTPRWGLLCPRDICNVDEPFEGLADIKDEHQAILGAHSNPCWDCNSRSGTCSEFCLRKTNLYHYFNVLRNFYVFHTWAMAIWAVTPFSTSCFKTVPGAACPRLAPEAAGRTKLLLRPESNESASSLPNSTIGWGRGSQKTWEHLFNKIQMAS